jgi:formate/nitrite transporter FocA (FNT family)
MPIRRARLRGKLRASVLRRRALIHSRYLCWMGEATVPVVETMRNIVVVTAGNVVGGTLLVAGVYWVAYLRGERRSNDGLS